MYLIKLKLNKKMFKEEFKSVIDDKQIRIICYI